MREEKFQILKQERPAEGICDLHLLSLGEERGTLVHEPGQFVALKLDGFYLRRPISVADEYLDDEGRRHIRLIYKCFGAGTAALAGYPAGRELSLLEDLGRGFCREKSAGKVPLLVGGGVGIPPLYFLAKKWCEEGVRPEVYLGFRSREELFLLDDFRRLGLEPHAATDDGSFGFQGRVTEMLPLRGGTSYVYSCGPLPMLRSLLRLLRREGVSGQFSLEERMGCGFGACMGCSHPMRSGSKRVCKEGPVFFTEDLAWE